MNILLYICITVIQFNTATIMKQVKLKHMTLTNFRGHKNLQVEFADKTIISGDNRLGKSTVFDAFVWCLFGKDQFDRKDFEIIPIIDGKRLDRVDSEVCIVLDVDDREISLKRALHQKWVRKRGTAEEVFDGCETLYYMNDVPLKSSEYKARVDMIVEESLFKLITNPASFLSLHWTKQREFLFQIAGTVSDAEIAASNPKFSQLLELVNGKSLIEFKKEIAARKKKLNDDLDTIQPKIDQTVQLMPDVKDFAAIEAQIKEIDEQIKAIDLQLSDKALAIKGQYDEIQRKQGEINTLKSKQREVVNAENIKAQNLVFEQNKKKNELENNVATILQELKNVEAERNNKTSDLALKNSSFTQIEIELTSLRTKWVEESAREYEAKEGCLICPVFGNECGDVTAKSKHVEAQELAKKAFYDKKNSIIESINNEGVSLKSNKDVLEAQIMTLSGEITVITNKVIELNDKHENAKKELAALPAIEVKEVKAEELPEWVEIQNKIKAIEATIEHVAPVDNTVIDGQKSELVAKRDELKKQLNSRELIDTYKQEVKSLEAKGSELAQQIADVEKQEFAIDAFNKAKIEECDKRINGLFKIVKFQLFDKTNDGNEFECCIATNKLGVPIAATNTAERINAGLDVIETLSKFYNVSATIFVDNSEAINRFIETSSQMVHLVVTKEPVLTIN